MELLNSLLNVLESLWDLLLVAGRTLWQESATFAAGRSALRWPGRDALGGAVPPGIYVLSVEANGGTVSRRFAMVR